LYMQHHQQQQALAGKLLCSRAYFFHCFLRSFRIFRLS
jgi:hypothetical protein